VRRGTSVSFFTATLLGAGLFLLEPLAFGVEALVKTADWASSVSCLRRASRSAMFARRCFSKSDISVVGGCAMSLPRCTNYGQERSCGGGGVFCWLRWERFVFHRMVNDVIGLRGTRLGVECLQEPEQGLCERWIALPHDLRELF
jgi:hypothetical protein